MSEYDEDYVGEYPDEPIDGDQEASEEAEAVRHKTEFYRAVSKLNENEYNIFVKTIQLDALMKMLDAVKHLNETPKKTWDAVISRLKGLKGIKGKEDPSGFDFGKFIDTMLPLLGMLATGLAAMKAFDKKAAELDNVKSEELDAIQAAAEAEPIQSIILEYCNNNQNGYSF